MFTQENAERWQTEYALYMQAAGFNLERGIHGSKAKHMDPTVYNAIKAKEAKLEAEKDGLKKQKEVLEDEVDTLQSEKDALTIEIETLNREKKQAETDVKGLQTKSRNLAIQKTQLTTERTELQSQLSEGKITLDEYNRKLQSVHLALGTLTIGRRFRTQPSANNSIMLSIHLARLSWMQPRIVFSENVSFG